MKECGGGKKFFEVGQGKKWRGGVPHLDAWGGKGGGVAKPRGVLPLGEPGEGEGLKQRNNESCTSLACFSFFPRRLRRLCRRHRPLLQTGPGCSNFVSPPFLLFLFSPSPSFPFPTLLFFSRGIFCARKRRGGKGEGKSRTTACTVHYTGRVGGGISRKGRKRRVLLLPPLSSIVVLLLRRPRV